jgi:hypothetical protein
MFNFIVRNYLFFVLGVLFFSMIGFSTATSQPVIDANEFPTTIGNQSWELTGGPYNFGFPLPGTPPWDFSLGPTTDTIVSTILDKSGAPYVDSFPAAAAVIREVTQSGTTWTYFSKNSSAFILYGFVEEPMVAVYNDPVRILEFPIMMGDAWSDTASFNFMSIPVTVFYDLKIVEWGDLTVPAFFSLPSLAMRTRIIFQILGFPADTSWSYDWLVENWGFGSIADTDVNDSTFQVADEFTRLWMIQQVGVEESNDEYRTRNFEFRLFQNQPNPFHKLTAISYALPGVRGQGSGISERIPVHLAVYDIMGRLVEILVDEKQDPGIYQVEWDGNPNRVRSGIYFYRLMAGGNTYTRKMILLH